MKWNETCAVNNTVERKLNEGLEILKGREKGLDNFVNIKINFENEKNIL